MGALLWGLGSLCLGHAAGEARSQGQPACSQEPFSYPRCPPPPKPRHLETLMQKHLAEGWHFA